jgi:cytosine/uracil/thiamine/allantoin permease
MYYSWFGPSMMTPVMLGFLFTRTPSWSALVSCGVSLVFVLVCNTVVDVAPYQYEVNIFGGVLVAAVVFFASARWMDKDLEARGRLAAFQKDLATPAADETLRWDTRALQSYRIVGVLTIGIGVVVTALMFVPTTTVVKTLTAAAGGFTIAMGALMLWYFNRKAKES